MTTARAPRDPEHGGAMLVTMIVITSLLAGAVVIVRMQLSSTRATELTRGGITAVYCAEAGLTAARPTIAANYNLWASALGPRPKSQPLWLSSSAFSHDLDGDLVDDFEITIDDNDDEVVPTPNDLGVDLDQKIFIVSRCIKFPDTPKQVTELIQYRPEGATCYDTQWGGCNGRGNANR